LEVVNMTQKSLYERLGGVFAIAAVVDHFSDAVVRNPIVGVTSNNPALREWHTKRLERLPGLKFMRTLWVCAVAGGPFQYTPTKPGKTAVGLEEAHRDLKISPDEFDEVAAELGRTLDVVKVPRTEKEEVLAAFAAHKNEVTAGYMAKERAREARRRVAPLSYGNRRCSCNLKGRTVEEGSKAYLLKHYLRTHH
jgi:hemoglobin